MGSGGAGEAGGGPRAEGEAASTTVIGLEVHVRLDTAAKLFCGDLNTYGAPPNTHVCPVCLGLPGALPVLNDAAVELALRAGLALNCRINQRSGFDRKTYFYPDLPRGYQITQYHRPLAEDGWLDLPQVGRVDIRRVHLEEDAGKSVHDPERGDTAVDLNRAGVPLVEIVTGPDLPSPEAARRFLTHLKRLLEYLEISDCDMEKGSLRVDANLSLRRPDGRPGTRTEVKNLNSFSNVERALSCEARRQEALVRSGKSVRPATLLWDERRGATRPVRQKEAAADYRYLPDPDLPPVSVASRHVDAVRAALPEPPAARAERIRAEYGLPGYDSDVLTASRALADYFEAVVGAGVEPKAASNWVMRDVLGWLNESDYTMEAFPLVPDRLAELIRMVEAGEVSATAGRTVFREMARSGGEAGAVVDQLDLRQVRDAAQLRSWIEAVLAEHPEEARRLEAGETKLLGFFVGQVMARSEGRADPRRVARLLTSVH